MEKKSVLEAKTNVQWNPSRSCFLKHQARIKRLIEKTTVFNEGTGNQWICHKPHFIMQIIVPYLISLNLSKEEDLLHWEYLKEFKVEGDWTC